MSSILILESDSRTRERLVEFLQTQGHSVHSELTPDEALERLRTGTHCFDLAIIAWDLLGSIGAAEFLLRLKQLKASIPRIIVAPAITLNVWNRAFALGARDVLLKPVDSERLCRAVENALDEQVKVIPLVAELRRSLVGECPEFVAAVVQLAQSIRSDNAGVLLIGESGVGKEVFARLFHQKGSPEGAPLEAVNLAGLSPSLIESELFGHEKGAFTGADRRHIGAFERAKGGTLFLDEIGYLDASLQPRLLRAIDQKHFHRVGGTEEVELRARLVCATSLNLADAVRAGSFRVDLYHRINGFEIRIPPLRERREDIRPLIQVLMRDSGVKVERETQQILESYSFPGNVRELDSLLKRSMAVSDGCCLTPGDLPGEIMREREQPTERDAPESVEVGSESWPEAFFHSSYKEAVDELLCQFDRAYFSHRLALAGNNRERLAREIGISSRTLRDKLKTCGLGHLIRGETGEVGSDSGDKE